MRTSSRPDPGWQQFARMVYSGVPHAVDIASALSFSRLTVPAAPRFDARRADLAFYRPVHLAFRRDVLRQFLAAMEASQSTPFWQHLKVSRSLQLLLVEDYLACRDKPVATAQWLADHLEGCELDVRQTPHNLPLYTADRRAA